MNALKLGSHGRRILFPLTGAALIGVAFFAAPRVASFGERSAPVATLLSRPAPLREPAAAQTLPFTIVDIVSYFTTALETKPTMSAGRFVFTGTANGHAEDLFHIAISAEARDLVVAFSGGGDYGLTLAREFFEAPFFTRDETFRFFTLLEESRAGPATAKLRRFTVRFTHLGHSDDFHLTLRFTPRAS